ncbi:MAG TPA: hypothetical protein VK912_19940 [Longimicrobiales bacterium]|nr:hypothetical protein [Longimicrobiales bacterium]
MIRFTIQLLAALVLLIAGPAGGTHVAGGSSHGPLAVETIGASGHLTAGDALPAAGFMAAAAGAELELRTGRSTAPRQTLFHGQHGDRANARTGSVHTSLYHSCDIASRLQRGGLANSSLGTPPPDA